MRYVFDQMEWTMDGIIHLEGKFNWPGVDDRSGRKRNMTEKTNEFGRFNKTMQKVVSVSHEELKRREEEWKKKHPQTGKKRGRKKQKPAGGRGR
jgi:hypothetical protein